MKILLSSGLCYTQPNKRNDANLISDFTFILSYLNLALSNQAHDNTTKEKEKSRPIVKPIPGYIFTSFQTTAKVASHMVGRAYYIMLYHNTILHHLIRCLHFRLTCIMYIWLKLVSNLMSIIYIYILPLCEDNFSWQLVTHSSKEIT